MVLLGDIRVQAFRCFEDLTVEGLGRLNVIVGANNSGKSALLDAVHVLTTKGHPGCLWDLLRARGQLFTDAVGEELGDVSELFWGRPNLRLLESGGPIIRLSSTRESVTMKAIGTAPVGLEVQTTGKDFVLTLVAGKGVSRAQIQAAEEEAGPAPLSVVHVRSQLTPPLVLQRGWAPLAGNPGEETVAEALRCIDPSIERSIYAPNTPQPLGYEGWYLRRVGSQLREPFSRQGEGLKRALALSIAMANAEGGTLLVDEVENGLHYTVIPEIWRFLIRASRKLNLQVFMTSHSRDLIDGFGRAQELEGTVLDDVVFFRLERGNPHATRISHRVAASLGESGQDLR